MNVKLRVLTVGVLFFTGQAVFAQEKESKNGKDKETKIEEVVVLGYSKTATKAKTTTSSVTVGAETLENRPNISVLNSIQGTAPGIVVNSASGSPGSGKFNILIRGTSSLNGSTDPLYVIDGVITSGSQFRNLNSYDIDTFSILKDAQATAIYGNRAANGVVVITTKGGKFNSGLKVSYDALTSFSKIPGNKYNASNARELLQLQKILQAGKGNTLTQQEIDTWATDTDWNKVFTRVGISQQHNLAITGGGENINNFLSLGYVDSEGTVKSTDFKRFTLRNNLNGKSKNGKLTFGSIIGLGYSKRNQLDDETNTGIANNTLQNPLFGGILSRPYIGPSPYANGKELFNAIGNDATNNRQWILQDNVNGGIQNRFTELSISANANVNYKITDYLSIGNRTGIEYKEYQRTFARSPLGYLSISVANSDGSTYGGNEDFTTTNDLTFNSITNITFNKSFGDHTISAGAYMDYIKAHVSSTFQRQNGLNPLQWQFGAGTGYIPFNPDTPNYYRPSVSASKVTAGTLAYFGTLDYDYKDKYGVSGVVRRDGSYRFLPTNRWETFWSVAGRWNIDKENFMADSGFRLLKLRASIGTTGNQNLGIAADNQNPLALLPNNFLDLYSGISGYQNLLGYNFTNLSNPYLKWEQVKQTNIGLDFNYKGLIEGSVDYYQKRTTRMFNDLQKSSVTGYYSIRGNDGVLDNKGVEGLIRYNAIKTADTKLSIFANAAYNSNKIVSMGSENLAGDVVHAIGGPAGQYQLYPYIGVNPDNGNLQFLDRNGNITEAPTSADRRLTGKSRYAKFTGGFGFNFQHKGWFFDTLFSFQQGGWIYDNLNSWLMDPNAVVNRNLSADLLNAWTPDNRNTDVPSLGAKNLSLGSSDRFLRRSDFVRLKNISVGYNFTKEQLGKLPVKGIKVFVQAENLYTWTKWKGFDPEPITSYSLNVYPNPKTVSVGLNVDF
ncbi:SusC/RagA family TonB-linked outer membrane protein [Chryseobacterium arthrosphaerae]|uniref:SusC/RagA family TonB-linked outer membrane protein n=1 Tax=Chryseobacterium arthrosphaerae TaxID=651561 RepID=UPI000F4DC0C8|nr:SusC/RagA family TonB-linked outer membrane protein [Chryseobacterium arthrosphaerae]AYZ13259.1 SusC/RagA family TonB-linked outer membrane protein [Chryseobacterium arthrosphaerae]MDG4652128.1 SusC/RagA family TonB-linked outer membrane protein [Chryseobacterium arthrosphaerae]UEQ78541.1 SusC/RagA family TonB-linked outer membrane protein [Chryseobacterium arthrosphaerae]